MINKEFFIEQLSRLYNRDYSSVVKKKHGQSQEVSFGELCALVFTENSMTEVGKKLGNMSPKTLRNALYNAFPDLADSNKGTVWRVELLSKLGYRKCISCDVDKCLDEFYNHVDSKLGKSYMCKNCAKEVNRIQRIERPEIIKASNKKRKAIVRGAFIEDANLDLIKLIYKNCPIGYHVDHVIPIAKGGKHHENNLCYLPAKLNMQKQAKLPEEVPEIMKEAIYPLEIEGLIK